MKVEYVIEPRKEDGSLDVKRIGTEPLKGQGTEDQIFKYFFSKHPKKETASWSEVNTYFNQQGLFIRRKYW